MNLLPIKQEYRRVVFVYAQQVLDELQLQNPRGHILSQDMRHWETYDEQINNLNRNWILISKFFIYYTVLVVSNNAR